MAVTVVQGDCIEVMKKWKAESVDAIVCDPPYALEFMGKEWDSFSETSRSAKGNKQTDKWGHAEGGAGAYKSALPRYNGKQKQSLLPFQQWCEEWGKEALRILKPGGYILAFGGSRTYHRLAAGLEDAGFEIRDSIIWMYGSGFPKSLNVSKAIDKEAGAKREVVGRSVYGDGHTQNSTATIGFGGCDPSADQRLITAPATDDARTWEGWGTALKPAYEPIVVGRKATVGTVTSNILTYGTGALNNVSAAAMAWSIRSFGIRSLANPSCANTRRIVAGPFLLLVPYVAKARIEPSSAAQVSDLPLQSVSVV